MRFWTHDRYDFPLPIGHRFPLLKYRLLRERLVHEGVARDSDMAEADCLTWEQLALVHDAEWLDRVRQGLLSKREQRVLGLPWSPQLVNRARRAAGGTLAAARDALAGGIGMVLGGGTHHAGVRSGRGFCLVNDVAASVALLRSEGLVDRVLIVDCDVHQGDGTAEIYGASGADPGSASVFTLSLHGERNYPFTRIPSDLDVDLPSGCRDDEYCEALAAALARALGTLGTPDLAFYLAGADPWEGDRLGKLALTKPGLRHRDELVIDALLATGAPTCVTLAGGYAPDVEDTVDINLATAQVVAERALLLARSAA